MTPTFKKGDKQLIENYRPISLLPICGKMLGKIIFNANNFITKNPFGFRPGDSTSNQLFYLVNEIHRLSRTLIPWKFVLYFLIFKLK